VADLKAHHNELEAGELLSGHNLNQLHGVREFAIYRDDCVERCEDFGNRKIATRAAESAGTALPCMRTCPLTLGMQETHKELIDRLAQRDTEVADLKAHHNELEAGEFLSGYYVNQLHGVREFAIYRDDCVERCEDFGNRKIATRAAESAGTALPCMRTRVLTLGMQETHKELIDRLAERDTEMVDLKALHNDLQEQHSGEFLSGYYVNQLHGAREFAIYRYDCVEHSNDCRNSKLATRTAHSTGAALPCRRKCALILSMQETRKELTDKLAQRDLELQAQLKQKQAGIYVQCAVVPTFLPPARVNSQ
jgi:cytochrome b involved in lipid metabolism